MPKANDPKKKSHEIGEFSDVNQENGHSHSPKEEIGSLSPLEYPSSKHTIKENEQDYRKLMDSIDQGFCIIQLLFDENEVGYDYRFIETNRAFVEQTGFQNAIGRTMLEIIPQHESAWMRLYGEVAKTGIPKHFEEFAARVRGGAWYSVYAFRVGNPDQNLVAVLFNDITNQKNRHFRQEFLDKLNKLLISSLSADEMVKSAAALTSEFLHLSICDFVDVNDTEDEVIINYSYTKNKKESSAQTLRLSEYFPLDFIGNSRLGNDTIRLELTIEEKKKIESIYGITGQSLVIIPFHRHEEWAGYLIVVSEIKRNWGAETLELLEEISERVFPRAERLRILDDLRRSEEKYRMLLNSMDQGYCIIELMYNAEGEVCDWKYLEVNPAFEKNNGLSDVIGKTIMDLTPDIEPKWFTLYGNVVRTGDSVRFIEHSEAFGRWFDIYAFRVGKIEEHKIAVFFTDITQRKVYEQQQVFLSEITKDLVELEDIDQTLSKLGEKIARHFKVAWCHFAEISESLEAVNISYGWSNDEVSSIRGTHQLKGLWSQEQILRNNKGEITVVSDTQTDPRVSKEGYHSLNIRSFVAVPLARDGQFHFMIGVADQQPRQWSKSEVELLKELTNRIWIRLEKAKAEEDLRKSRSQLSRELSDTQKLQQISTRIIAGGNIQTLYETILELIADIMEADFAGIHLLDDSGNEMTLEAYRNLDPQSLKYWHRITKDNTTSCGQAFQKWERIIISDIDDATALINQSDYEAYQVAGIKAMQSTPMVSRRGKKMGIISTCWRNPHYPSAHKINLFDAVVRQVADLIESREAEELLIESEERMRIILDAAVDFSIIYIDKDGIIKGWNTGAERLFEYKPEEIIGKPLRTIFDPHDREKGRAEEEMEMARNEGLASYERWHEKKDGTKIYLVGVLRPVYNPQFSGYVKITRDMTERKLIERQKDDFISIASHELKTPVTSIKAYAELIKDIMTQSRADEETLILMTKLNHQVDRMIRLIHTLLDVAIISRGKFTLSPSEFDLRDLLQERIEDIRITSETHCIRFACDEKIVVNADRERIGEIVTNFLSNAIKYSDKGTEIEVGSRTEENGVTVYVRDQGMGISEEGQKKLFERFYRIQSEKKSAVPGLGLGLYISAAIIYQHNGKIWLESELNKGSTFYFFLPFM